MSEKVELTRSDLFGDGRAHDRVREFLKQALTRKTSVMLTVHANGATLALQGGLSTGGTMVEGAARVPGIEPLKVTDSAARVLLPLLFHPTVIRLAPGDLVTLGHPYRPVADLFSRCLLFAELRGSPIDWQTREIVAPDISRDLLHRYYFVLKAYLPDPTLSDRKAAEVLDLLLVNLYFEVLPFKNSLLQAGAQSLRNGRAVVGVSLRADLESARAAMVTLFAQ